MSEAHSTSLSTTSDEETTQSRTLATRLKDWIIGTTFVGFVARGTLIPLSFYLSMFAFAFWRAWVDPEGSADFFDYLRSLFEVVVSLSSMLIIIGVAVLIIQIARFVNLLRSEVKPITRDTTEAIKNVRVTAEFVQKNAVKPVIEANAFLAGLIAFLREIASISKILQRENPASEEDVVVDTGDGADS